MNKVITKLAVVSTLFIGAATSVVASADTTTTSIPASTVAASNIATTKPVNNSKQFKSQVQQYMQLLKNSKRTKLVNALIASGKPVSLSDLGGKIALHSENQAATTTSEANANAQFYTKFNQIFHKQINHKFQCDDGYQLGANLKRIRHFNHQKMNPQKVMMTGMGLGDSLDFGNIHK